jgi:hypothetical protein
MNKTDLKPFDEGQLCFVVIRPFQGKGAPKIIMHEAKPEAGGFGYGAFRTWVVSPATLMGMTRSNARAKASKINGAKGGRPRK